MNKQYKKAQKRTLAIFDWILILGLVLMIYILAEELLYKVSEKGDISIWITSFAFGCLMLVAIFSMKRVRIRNKMFKNLIGLSLISGLLLSVYILMEEGIYYIAEKGEFARWEVAAAFLIGLFTIGAIRYFGREQKFVNRVADRL